MTPMGAMDHLQDDFLVFSLKFNFFFRHGATPFKQRRLSKSKSMVVLAMCQLVCVLLALGERIN
jgi:hypothetical protein